MTDETPTPPAEHVVEAPKPAETPESPKSPDTPAERHEHSHDNSAVLSAIGELKDLVTGIVVVGSQSVDDQTPVKRPWFARGGKS